ncbi:MAG: hypothetical protein KAR15_15535 [Desulfobacterales bacterium]|nr:hypothetical protein [Desulfobacterales bacterium]
MTKKKNGNKRLNPLNFGFRNNFDLMAREPIKMATRPIPNHKLVIPEKIGGNKNPKKCSKSESGKTPSGNRFQVGSRKTSSAPKKNRKTRKRPIFLSGFFSSVMHGSIPGNLFWFNATTP